MQPPFHFDARTVFVKSAKGREEFARRGDALNARERRALILIDGTKDLNALGRILPMREFRDALASLVSKGLIEECNPAAQPATSSDTTPRSRPGEDEERIRPVKDFMIVTAQTYLGLLGADVIRHVEQASDTSELLTAAGHWHMALHASKQGKRFAAPYLEQVRNALLNQDALEFS